MCHMMGVMRAAAPAVVDALSCSGTHAHAGGGDDDGQQILDGAPYDETCRQMPSEHIAKQVGKADFGAACSTWQRNSVNEQLDHGAGGEADQQVGLEAKRAQNEIGQRIHAAELDQGKELYDGEHMPVGCCRAESL